MFSFCSRRVKHAATIEILFSTPVEANEAVINILEKRRDITRVFTDMGPYQAPAFERPRLLQRTAPRKLRAALRPAHQHIGSECRRLRNNIRRDLVFDEGDAVAQLQLAFFQALQPQQVRRWRLMQRIDCRVEVAVFLLQASELGRKLALIFVGHGLR
jgi:hypothetical protein